MARCRRQDNEIKQLQELNTVNAKNSNNTSSEFTLPSEFKEAWTQLVSEKILDALPDFLNNFHLLVPMVQEIFGLMKELLENKK